MSAGCSTNSATSQAIAAAIGREPARDLLLAGFSTTDSFDGVVPVVKDDSDGAVVTGDQVRLVGLLRALTGYVMSRVPGAAPTVHVSRQDAMVRIDISAPGETSVDHAEIAALFDQPLPEPHDGGLGLKLLIAHAIVVAHSGSLMAEALPGGGC